MLTVGKVDVFGDLVPRAVVKMADLLFVLHHVGRLSSLFVLHRDVVLDGFKILPVLRTEKTPPISIKRSHGETVLFV